MGRVYQHSSQNRRRSRDQMTRCSHGRSSSSSTWREYDGLSHCGKEFRVGQFDPTNAVYERKRRRGWQQGSESTLTALVPLNPRIRASVNQRLRTFLGNNDVQLPKDVECRRLEQIGRPCGHVVVGFRTFGWGLFMCRVKVEDVDYCWIDRFLWTGSALSQNGT